MTKKNLWALVAAATVSSLAFAQEEQGSPAASDAPKAEETKSQDDQLTALAEELRRLKLEIGIPDVSYEQYAGMGPAASKVYFVPRGLSLGGYGEAIATYFPMPGKKNETDMLRLILYVGYRFTDRIVFNSEIEFEHGHSQKGGEVAVEFAYLDFKLHDALQLRVGNVLVPMGFINEVHEPAFFNGVIRPDLERNLIPSTWNENGVGVFGEALGLRYKAYVIAGLNAVKSSDDSGFSEASWIRNGRQRGAKAVWENVAAVANLSYEQDLFGAGASAFYGRSGQGVTITDAEGTRVVEGETFLAEAHARFSLMGLTAKAIVAMGSLNDAGEITALQNAAGVSGTVASQVMGGYGELSYDLATVLMPGSEQAVTPFVRYEVVNLHAAVPETFTVNEARNTHVITAGVTYKPVATVAVKLDYQRRFAPAAEGTTVDQFNAGVGFVF